MITLQPQSREMCPTATAVFIEMIENMLILTFNASVVAHQQKINDDHFHSKFVNYLKLL